MVSVPKIIAKMRRQPNGIRYSELNKVLENYGYHKIRQNGSHIFYSRSGSKGFPIPIHGKFVKEVYIALVLEIVDKEEF